MWKLRAPSEQLLKWYEKKLLEGLSTRIKSNQDENDNILLDERIQRILIPHNPDGSDDTSILKLLLTLPPKELHELRTKKLYIISIILLCQSCVRFLIMMGKFLLISQEHIN